MPTALPAARRLRTLRPACIHARCPHRTSAASLPCISLAHAQRWILTLLLFALCSALCVCFQFHAELRATAKKIATAGKGILAADESTGTIGARFKDINLPNTHENRIEYRRLLFTTPELEKYVSGVILFEETLFDKDPSNGQLLVKPLMDRGIVLGIKVDQGTKHLPGTDNETYTQVSTQPLQQQQQQQYSAYAHRAWSSDRTQHRTHVTAQQSSEADCWSVCRCFHSVSRV